MKEIRIVEISENIRMLFAEPTQILNNLTYKNYTIRHKNGKHRLISVPNPTLKIIQKAILNYILYPYYSSLCHSQCQGFRREYGTARAAKLHINKKYVMNLDVQDFFFSINIDAVKSTLNKIELINSPLSTEEIAIICTNKARLPQGAPTSPFLSNIVMYEIDQAITEAAEGYTYTRYADDMTFSGNKHPGYLIEEIRKILRNEGLLLNNRKTKIMMPHQRQNVLGITVNEKRSIPRKLRRSIRMQLYNLARQKTEMPKELEGMLRYIKSINLIQHNNLIDYYTKISNRMKDK